MREDRLIQEIRKRAGKPGKPVVAGIGDDCAVLDLEKDRYLLWAADMIVEGTHFRIPDVPFKKIGWKAVAVNISDIAAMGGLPRYLTVSIGVPKGMKDSSIRGVYDGIFSACEQYGIKLLGGDTVLSRKLVIDVSIMGAVEKSRLTLRSGAKEGDLVLVTGPVRDGKKQHADLTPRLDEARSLTRRNRVSSMIDTSDGIAPDAGRLCRQSRKGCLLYEGAIPLSKGLSLRDALYYGESFELLFTMSPRQASKLFRDMKITGEIPGYFVIGEITKPGEGMRLAREDGSIEPLKTEGFKHL